MERQFVTAPRGGGARHATQGRVGGPRAGQKAEGAAEVCTPPFIVVSAGRDRRSSHVSGEASLNSFSRLRGTGAAPGCLVPALGDEGRGQWPQV